MSIEDLADPDRAEQALTHWDEIEPKLLTAIESHPQHGPRLSMLRRADRWLEARGPELRPAGPCPTSEELYDFGRGPGFGPLSANRRHEIDAHLRRCAECETMVETLAAPPPVPLELPRFPADADGRVEGRPNVRAGGRLLKLQRLAPLAAAAAVLLTVGVWYAIEQAGTTEAAFPSAPLLRGSSTGNLLFPRDRVLHPTEAVRNAFPALEGSLTIEVEPKPDAASYRIAVARHGKDPFATEEKSLVELSGAGPTFQSKSLTASALPVGEYTWTARAKVRGLDQPLGQRDFAIVDDPKLCAELLKLSDRAEPGRSLSAVNLLHAKGFLSDARAVARAMPASPERDAYLSRNTGR